MSREKLICCGTHQSIALPAAHARCGPDCPPVPDALRNMLDPCALNFNAEHHAIWKRHSRSLNSCLAFASSQVREAHMRAPRRPGATAPPHFVVNGEIQHNIGPIIAARGWTPRFAQMYFWDADQDEVLRQRQKWARLLEPDPERRVSARDADGTPGLLAALEAMIRQHHPYYGVAHTAWRRHQQLPGEVTIRSQGGIPISSHLMGGDIPPPGMCLVLLGGLDPPPRS